MPLYDYICPAGHSTERRVASASVLAPCGTCGAPAARAEVHMVAFAVRNPARGEKVASYLEAAQELEYRHGRQDDPAFAGATEVFRPAFYRAQARLHNPHVEEAPDKRRWAPKGAA